MSLELFPTYPKIRAEQLDQVNWNQVAPLINLINTGDANTLSAALSPSNLDPAVAGIINTSGSSSRTAVRNAIDAAFLDPLVADRVNTSGTQTRSAIQSLISGQAVVWGSPFNGGSTDWNTLTTPGIYPYLGTGTGGSNRPPIVSTQNGVLFVIPQGGDIRQVAINAFGEIAVRARTSGTWGGWIARNLYNVHTITLGANTNLTAGSWNTVLSATPGSIANSLGIWWDTAITPTILVRVVAVGVFGAPATINNVRIGLRITMGGTNLSNIESVAPVLDTTSGFTPALTVQWDGTLNSANPNLGLEMWSAGASPQAVATGGLGVQTRLVITGR